MKVNFKISTRHVIKSPSSNFNHPLLLCRPLIFVLRGINTHSHVEWDPIMLYSGFHQLYPHMKMCPKIELTLESNTKETLQSSNISQENFFKAKVHGDKLPIKRKCSINTFKRHTPMQPTSIYYVLWFHPPLSYMPPSIPSLCDSI